jgi:hypothetical protein
MDTVSSVVPARAWGVYRIDAKLRPADMTCRGVPDAFLSVTRSSGARPIR